MNALTRGLAAAAVLLFPGLALAGAAAPGPVTGSGSLVIVGGALKEDNAAVYRAVLKRRLPGRALCVIPLASEDPVRSAGLTVKDFEKYGGPGCAVPVNFTRTQPARATDEAFARQLAQCGGFFFTGGDQSRIVDVLRPGGASTPAYEAMLGVLREGGVVAGTSAGAAMMSDPMIGGGDSADALEHGVTEREDGKGAWVRNGMGFLAGALTDQHFLARGRLGRTLAVLADGRAGALAFGVDENTALVVEADGFTALGASGVVVVDARQAQRDPQGGFTGARLWLLGSGDRFDPAAGQGRPAADKAIVAQTKTEKAPPRDPWKDDVFVKFLAHAARVPAWSATLPAGRFTLRLVQGPGFAAQARAADALFAGPFTLDLVPATAAPEAR